MLGIGMGCSPAVLTLDHRAPERDAPDDAVEEGPAQGLRVHDAVLEVGSRLLGVGRAVDPASAAFFGGTMVGESSPPGSKEREGPMSTGGEELATGWPQRGVDEA